MKDFNWKIIFIFQAILICSISGILFFKMGYFNRIIEDVVIHEVEAEESLKNETENIVKNIPLKEEVKKEDNVEIKKIEPKKEEVKKEETTKILARKTDSEVKEVMDKYKDQIKSSYIATVTSYNSESGQTDDSPCITASNLDVCKRNVEDIVATNDLPFHTKILIPEYFGDRIFYVEDRMNKRYTGLDRLDVWMKNKTDSKNFGAKVLKIIILK